MNIHGEFPQLKRFSQWILFLIEKSMIINFSKNNVYKKK